MYYLSNSIGGYAPYTSVAGIFISSTNSTIFLPGGGMSIVLPFLRYVYNLISNDDYVANELVLAENVNPNTVTSLTNLSMVVLIIIVLPVPVTPVINNGKLA